MAGKTRKKKENTQHRQRHLYNTKHRVQKTRHHKSASKLKGRQVPCSSHKPKRRLLAYDLCQPACGWILTLEHSSVAKLPYTPGHKKY
uniref:Uncharacterized protein n=1 Tax=Arundo donax TaxID=35708 RepID=A0A0A9R048_ARUDO